jgi:hypothetical protein
MDDGIDGVLTDQSADQIRVGYVALDEQGLGRNRPVEPLREVVDHDHTFPCIEQFPYHMAADVTCAPCHQNCHATPLPLCFDPVCIAARTCPGEACRGCRRSRGIPANARLLSARTVTSPFTRS